MEQEQKVKEVEEKEEEHEQQPSGFFAGLVARASQAAQALVSPIGRLITPSWDARDIPPLIRPEDTGDNGWWG